MSLKLLGASLKQVAAPFVFGIPGGGPSLALMDSLAQEGAQLFTTRFEGAAAMMAGTVGRLTGKPGLAVAIKGPGLANLIPGLAFSSLESYPMIAVAEAYTPSVPLAKAHKRLAHAQLTAAVTKSHRFWSEKGPSIEALAQHALAEVPGPVMLDIADAPIADEKPLPEAPEMAKASQALLGRVAKAERPLVIAGTLAIRAGWRDALSKLNIPVFSTAAAKGLIDEGLAHAGGIYTGVGLEFAPEHSLLPRCDLVIALGLRTNEVLAAGFKVSAVALDPAGPTTSPGYQFEAFGNGSEFTDLCALLARRSWGQEEIAQAKARLEDRLGEGGFLPAAAYRAVQQRFAGKCRVVLDTGYFCTIGEHACHAQKAEWFLGSGQARDMGAGTPMAIAAAICSPDVPTILATGDGGIGMYAGEFRLAVEHQLPLMVLLMTDGGFGSILGRARALGLTEQPLLMKDPSWREIMKAMGFPAYEVRTQAALEQLLAKWDGRGPLFVEAVFDPTAYQAMVKGIRD